jgi:hypothetical protein
VNGTARTGDPSRGHRRRPYQLCYRIGHDPGAQSGSLCAADWADGAFANMLGSHSLHCVELPLVRNASERMGPAIGELDPGP